MINLLGIVAAGGAVLALSGFGAVDERGGQRLLTLSAACGIALAVLAFPLATTGRDNVRRDSLESAVRANVGEWLEPVEPAVVLDVLVEGEHAILLVVSTGVPPPTVRLERAVADTLGRHATIEVRWLHAIELGNS